MDHVVEKDPTGDPIGPQFVVRQYGLLDPLDWDQDCQEHLWRENKFWNTLVELEKKHRDAYFRLTGSDPELKEIEDALSALMEEKEARIAEKKALRQAARKKAGVDTSAQDLRIEEIRPEIRRLSGLAKETRKKTRERMKPEIDALERTRREDVKIARNASGLWWGNYNAVCASYETARVRAMRTGGDLRFHSFDGTGRFTCQIQGGMTVGEFFSGDRNSVVSADPVSPDAFYHPSRGARRRAARTTLRMTVYTTKDENGKYVRRILSFPMILHREIPSDVLIKQVVVTRKRVGATFRWTVTLTGTRSGSPRIVPALPGACGIDLGWRLVPEGLRVASIANDKGVRHIVLPEKMLRRMDHVEDLKSRIDQELNRIMTWFRGQWGGLSGTFPEPIRERFVGHIRSPKVSPRKLAGSILAWRDAHGDFRPDLLSALETWRKTNKRLTQEMDNLREKLSAQRTDLYRNEALRIVREHSCVALEDFDLREVVKLETPEGEKTDQPAAARANRVRAAVSDLRNWIGIQAAKTGTEIVRIPAADTTRACRQCLHVNLRRRPEDLVWTCDSCGAVWDQDENAARNLLMAAEMGQENAKEASA
ncbi:MAG: zinc ribbon domain-containing protein [Leptospirales bacterium]